MDDEVTAYVDSIPHEQRPLFDRVHRLITQIQPGVSVVLKYKMPTYAVGERQLHVGVWKHGLSFYGWQAGKDGGFVVRHPELDSGKGTLRLPTGVAEGVGDDELRAFFAAVFEQP